MKIELNIEDRDEVTKFIRFLEDVTTALESARDLEYERLITIYGGSSIKKIGITGLTIDMGSVTAHPKVKLPTVGADSIIKLYIDKYNA